MIRIGIIGSDNSHAEIFSKMLNIPDENGEYAYPDARVVAIYGAEEARPKKLLKTVRLKPSSTTRKK